MDCVATDEAGNTNVLLLRNGYKGIFQTQFGRRKINGKYGYTQNYVHDGIIAHLNYNARKDTTTYFLQKPRTLPERKTLPGMLALHLKFSLGKIKVEIK
jgi:hypothetical protein